MDEEKRRQMVELFTRMAEAARADPEVATHVRDALAESGLLAVFGEGIGAVMKRCSMERSATTTLH